MRVNKKRGRGQFSTSAALKSISFNFAFANMNSPPFHGDNNNEKSKRNLTNNRTRPEGKKSLRVLREEIVVLMAGVVAGLERSDRPRPLAWHPPLHWPKLAERSAEVTASSVAVRLRVHLCAGLSSLRRKSEIGLKWTNRKGGGASDFLFIT